MYIKRGKIIRDPEWNIKWECGCKARVDLFVKCDMHTLVELIEKEQEQEVGPPMCPACSMGARRPKCAFESAYCPRHDIADKWEETLKNRINNDRRWTYGQL